MKVSQIKLLRVEGYCQLQGLVTMDSLGGKQFLLWYRFPFAFENYINPANGNAFVAALLLPAMVSGESLKIEAPVSQKLFTTLSTIQDIYGCWNKRLRKITVTAPVDEETQYNQIWPLKTASFFSGGVDSFYTLLKHTDREAERNEKNSKIDSLILVHGFDIRISKENDRIFKEALSSAQQVGVSLGKEVLPIATNIREIVDLFVNWESLGHGACLASVGLTLQNLFQTIYIASSYNYSHLTPWGSHPLLDPLWSTESLLFIHHGLEASRFEKIRFIAKAPIVLKNLRVCYNLNNHRTAYLNCGRCRKCLIVMIALHIINALKLSEVLPNSIDLNMVTRMQVSPPLPIIKDLYQALGQSKEDQEIKSAMEHAFLNARLDLDAYKQEDTQPTYLLRRIYELNQALATILTAAETIVLVDDDQLGIDNIDACRAIPFIEKGGKYWGPPADDKTAIQELERLQKNGTGFIVIAWTAFWWLEQYKEFTQYLYFNFNCVLQNDRLTVFDLRKQKKLA